MARNCKVDSFKDSWDDSWAVLHCQLKFGSNIKQIFDSLTDDMIDLLVIKTRLTAYLTCTFWTVIIVKCELWYWFTRMHGKNLFHLHVGFFLSKYDLGLQKGPKGLFKVLSWYIWPVLTLIKRKRWMNSLIFSWFTEKNPIKSKCKLKSKKTRLDYYIDFLKPSLVEQDHKLWI